MFKRFVSQQAALLKRAVFQPKLFVMTSMLKTGTFCSPQIVPRSSFSTMPFVNLQNNHVEDTNFISKDYLKTMKETSEKFKSLDSDLLNKIIDCYVENIFSEDSHTVTPEKISYILRNDEIGNLPKTPRAYASELYQALESITEFLEMSEKGFLTGDLDPKLILNVSKYVEEALDKIERKGSALSRDSHEAIVSECYDAIFKHSFEGVFRLPKRGISKPDLENPRNLFERQLILEDETNEIAVEKFLSVYDDLQSMGLSYNLSFAKHYIVDWFPNLTQAIKEEQEQCLLGDLKGDRKYYGPFLVKLSSEKLALIALTELMKSILKLTHRRKDDDQMQAYYMISKVMFDTIGKSVNAQALMDFEEEQLRKYEKHLEEEQSPTGEPTDEPNQKKKAGNAKRAALSKRILKKKISSEGFQTIGIPRDIQLKIGSLLVYLMKETIKVKNTEGFWQNLLSTGYTKIKGKKQYIGILNVNEQFIIDTMNRFEKTGPLYIQIDRCLPMIFKPAPWQDYEMGGYYQRPTNFMRIHESLLQERSIKFADLQPTFDVLDKLSQTPWRINRRVLKTIEAIWEEGGGAGEVPLRDYNYKNYIYDYQLKECKNRLEKAKLLKKIQAQRDMHSLRCDFNLKLNVAKAFESVEKFYFPHNIDFRGRIYPIPPHLNHISADLCRGLLEFAEGKPIGKTGLQWLKIHLANKMGKDKLSFADRIQYAESIIPVVERCVKDPLKHREWLEAEDCWQSLAAMYDLWDALSSPDPEKYVSHLHIHQDGSCNGLQHYAALGRDFAGATQVNLVNTTKPGDVYTHVANMVQAKIDKDANDPTSKNYELAKRLSGNVKRKIVKQTVMTSVYGVTFIGARKQIQKQLKDKEFIENDDEDRELYQASHYLARLTLDSIRDLFSGAHEIKKWLIQCASLIANTSNPVSWITPLGLPVIQPYRTKRNIDVVSTIIQKVTVSVDPEHLPVNKNKQRSAFPPNFIHSLDSTHLMYTAMECNKESITFAAVHDSYWTHAGTIDRMNEILRDQFIKLHSQPLLEDLKRSFERRYPEIEFPPIPERGGFDLEKVKESVYFFA